MSTIGAFLEKNTEKALFAISGNNLIELSPELVEIISFDEPICAAAFNDDDSELLISTSDKKVMCFSYPSLEQKWSKVIPRKSNIIFYHNNQWIVYDRFGLMFPIDSTTAASPAIYASIVSMPTSGCANDKFCSITDRDGHIRLYNTDLASHTIEYALNGHRSYVLAAKFLGDYIVSASNDGTIKIWDTKKPNADTGLETIVDQQMEKFSVIEDVFGNAENVCILWKNKSAEKLLTVVNKDLTITTSTAPAFAAKYYEFNGKKYFSNETTPVVSIDGTDLDFSSIAGNTANEQVTAELLLKMKERGE